MLQSWLQPGRNKKKSPRHSDGNKRLIILIFLAPLLATRKKIVTTLTFRENWIPGKK